MQTLLEKAMGGNDATAAATLWAYISRGEVSDAVALAWVRHVATRVVTDVVCSKEARKARRADAALKAVGLFGRVNRTRWLEEFAVSIETDDPSFTHKLAAQVAPLLEGDPIDPKAPYDVGKAERIIQRKRADVRKGARKKLQVPPKE